MRFFAYSLRPSLPLLIRRSLFLSVILLNLVDSDESGGSETEYGIVEGGGPPIARGREECRARDLAVAMWPPPRRPSERASERQRTSTTIFPRTNVPGRELPLLLSLLLFLTSPLIPGITPPRSLLRTVRIICSYACICRDQRPIQSCFREILCRGILWECFSCNET